MGFMRAFSSINIREDWPIIVSAGLLLFTLGYFFLVALPNNNCGSQRGVYWLWVIRPWIATLATIMAVALLLWIGSQSVAVAAMLVVAALCACGSSARSWYFAPNTLDTIHYQDGTFHLALCQDDLEYWTTMVYMCSDGGLTCHRFTCDEWVGGLSGESPKPLYLASGPGPNIVTIMNEGDAVAACQFRFTGP
jgi:hypothetical protein